MLTKPLFSRALFAGLTLLFFFASSLPGQAIQLNWNSNGTKCAYVSKAKDGSRSFYVVTPAEKVREPAFDHQQIASLIGKELDKEIDEHRLPFSRIVFADGTNETLLLSGAAGTWQLDLGSDDLKKMDANTTGGTDFFLPPRSSPDGGNRTDITITNQLDAKIELFWVRSPRQLQSYGTLAAGETMPMSTYVGHVWLIKDSTGKPLACFDSQADGHVVVTPQAMETVDTNARTNPRPGRARPNNRRRNSNQQGKVTVVDHDLWLENQDSQPNGSEPIRLTRDATAENSFARTPSSNGQGTPDIQWSPDENFLLATQRTVVDAHQVYYVESSPRDQLQPKLHQYSYPKPGDPVVEKTFRLFAADSGKEIPISKELMSSPYATRFIKWSDDGDRFWLHYNQRGHQVIRLLEVSVPDGQVRTVAENTSDTFLEYTNSAKSFHQFLPDDRLLWASERSGWNHLYRIDLNSGEVLNPVTSGPWNVKRIERVDVDNQQVWFYAVGVVPGQDPYHEHLCRVDWDGSHFQVLTEGDGTHSVSFEQERQFFVDTWSRVDLPPVHALRESSNGELICELSREAITDYFQERRMPERFTAVGRDGETDIWGIIHFPRDFDPDKKYPVVENIYAGPHDHHVPKSFRPNYRTQHTIADAGMIVVQIDGMGTAWRSKQFHDVCYKNLKDAGFPDRIAWIKAAAKKFPQMDVSRVGIYGGSAGGQNAMAALLWHHDFYSVAVADCGCHDNRMDKMWWNEQWMGYPVDASYAANSNVENANLLEGHLMLTVGEQDRNVDPSSTTQVVNALIEADKDFEFVLITGRGHGAGESAWAARKRLNFLKTHLNVED